MASDKPNPIELQKALGGVDYPASKQDIVDKAESSGASETVLNSLRALPDGEYDGPDKVQKAAFR
ncbi:DUF2795 domain-containing protein [Allostreptomyces psammosilenae]|uniref:DUF2795 domain-containing protein n=1 Tax=Allostreptomyces psammosilenae TaxID=1892865 RepID=A0A852ZSC0_9ACTN|nr:DUF2795 domain-containing protein [Allostreptomyces psammosilenae]NYI04170.1 hypothetical protein [Allostreptomyces psammosilenae]